MASEETSQGATISTEDRRNGALRQLSGTSFLTLEHVGYFALVVLMPFLLLMGITLALQMWRGDVGGDAIVPLIYPPVGQTFSYVDTSAAISLTAALVVLAPLMYILRRRVSAEHRKRPGYENRVAYKLPVYTALGVLAASTVSAFIAMLGVFLNSLISIGVSGANIGELYTDEFLPALLAFVVLGAAAWYTMCFAKGRDTSKLFVGATMLASAVLVVALFVTALTLNHQPRQTDPIRTQPYPYQDDTYLY